MTSKSRRQFLRSTAAALAFPMVNIGSYRVFAQSETTYSARAIDLVNANLVIDMLSVMAPLGPMFLAAFGDAPKRTDGSVIDPEHLNKLLSMGIDVFHPAIGVGTRDDAFSIMARYNAYASEHPGVFVRVDSVEDFEAVRAKDKIGFILGLQTANHFEELDDIDLFYNFGQRVCQLTYNSRNLIGTGATDRSDGGLSNFGVQVVERMNSLGMAVDVSHCGDRTTLDAFEVSTQPVLITHSNCRALVPGHPRCKTDEAIKATAKSGGVMGITGVRNFIRDKEPTTIEHMLDHYDHVARLVGVEHLGVGSDMDPDGYDDVPEPAYSALKAGYRSSYSFRDKIDTDGFDHPKRMYDLTEGLIRRGYSNEDIGKILGGNFKRALADIWSA